MAQIETHRILVLNLPFSGISKYLLNQLAMKGWELTIIDVPAIKIFKYLAIISAFRMNIYEWINVAKGRRNKFNTRSLIFLKRTRFCERQINKLKGKIDIILQFQGRFMPAINLEALDIPYVVFTDYTMKLAQKYPPWMPYNSQVENWHNLEMLLYQHASLNFTTSENTRKSFIDDYGIAESKVVNVGAGLTLDKIPEQPKNYDCKTILFIGKEFQRKGGFCLLDAFKKVKKIIPDAQLIIAGPRKMEFRINEPGVSFLGLVTDRNRIESLYNQASIFVMPSLCEPLGLVFLEAMAYSLPCIGTNVDAIPEIIEEGKTGFLVPPQDAGALANKIILLLQNEPLIRQMGRAGLLRLKDKFTWDKVAGKVSYYLNGIIKLRNKNF